MIHTTTRETLLRCDTPVCPEVDWLPPGTDAEAWMRENAWKSDDGTHYCDCCVKARWRQ